VFALKSNNFIDDNTKIKFYDVNNPEEYTSVKAFVKGYYKKDSKLQLFPKKIRLGKFDNG
jgi:hypothetical protein